ncbi:MAG: lipase maturation factor family protein [Myxococcaceae bacterium]|nr:lipase maturation factor family protein [Myxococcaceae bacterium]
MGYALTRFVMLRLVGLTYLCAFGVFLQQGPALIGEHGLLPAAAFLPGTTFFEAPSVFRFIGTADGTLVAIGWLGAGLSVLVLLGCTNAVVMALLWVLYLSVDGVGQTFWSFGWESQLLETGFLSIFFCPLFSVTPFPKRPAPLALIYLYRWLGFRLFIGAGLIKLRGDACWVELTCLDFHFETQPIPSPLTPFFHFLPAWAHKAGVLFNHLAELVAPWGFFGPRVVRRVCGLVAIAFQLTLIASGNLSFLNWLSLIPLIACLDDGLLQHLFPQRLTAPLALAERETSSLQHRWVAGVLTAVVAILSLQVVENLVSKRQHMNRTYDPFSLVNTYGAFGTVGRERDELVIEGSDDGGATWRAYELKCKPGDPDRRPCWMSPFHFRLDWQVWFAAMSTADNEPWLVHLIWKLLHHDVGARSLLANDPFPTAAPGLIRVRLFGYQLKRYGEPGWWSRTEKGEWLQPVSADTPELRAFIDAYGWLE